MKSAKTPIVTTVACNLTPTGNTDLGFPRTKRVGNCLSTRHLDHKTPDYETVVDSGFKNLKNLKQILQNTSTLSILEYAKKRLYKRDLKKEVKKELLSLINNNPTFQQSKMKDEVPEMA